MKHKKLCLNVRKYLFIASVTKHWNRLHKEIGFRSLKVTKSNLGQKQLALG